jgi:predicted small secreted protein
MSKPREILIALVATATLLAGCAASQQARDVQQSGFLGQDYELLRPGEEGEALLVYRDPDASWHSYDRIKLDPVTIWAGEGSEFEDFSEPERQELADTLYTMVHEELSQDFRMVDELGPGVLRVQVAITDAETSNPTMDTISTVLPQGLLLSQAKGLITGKPGFVGEASVEMKATDGETGELVAGAVDRRVGGKSVTGAPTDSWDDVREAYRYWAKQLRYRLCTERGATDCTPPEA